MGVLTPLLKHTRDDPSRSSLVVLALLTIVMQLLGTITGAPWQNGIPNLVLVVPVCVFALWSCAENSAKNMARSSFALSALWVWTGLTRLIIVEGVGELLWAPFIIVGSLAGVLYLHFSGERQGYLNNDELATG